MQEIVISMIIEKLLEFVNNKIKNFKEDYEWTKLFQDTGDFFIKSPDKLDSFKKDLIAVFSEENMIDISKKLKNERGYEFPKLLHDALCELMIQYKIPKYEVETYAHNFTEMIITYLENNDDEKSFEIFLGKWRREENKHFLEIKERLDTILRGIEDLKKRGVACYSIEDIDSEIKEQAKYNGLSLDFFKLMMNNSKSDFLSK